MTLRHRPDFQADIVYLAKIATRSRRRTTGAYLLLQTPSMGGTQFIFCMVELARFMVDSFSLEMHQVLSERGDLLLAVFGKVFRKKTFMNSIHFCYRLIVYS